LSSNLVRRSCASAPWTCTLVQYWRPASTPPLAPSLSGGEPWTLCLRCLICLSDYPFWGSACMPAALHPASSHGLLQHQLQACCNIKMWLGQQQLLHLHLLEALISDSMYSLHSGSHCAAQMSVDQTNLLMVCACPLSQTNLSRLSSSGAVMY